MTEENAATGYVLWLLADHHGTIRTVTDGFGPEGGTILHYITYDSFGNILPGSDTPARFAYTGQEFDAESIHFASLLISRITLQWPACRTRGAWWSPGHERY